MGTFTKFYKKTLIESPPSNLLLSITNPNGSVVDNSTENSYDMSIERIKFIIADHPELKVLEIYNDLKGAPINISAILKYSTYKKFPFWDKSRNEMFMVDNNEKSYFVDTDLDKAICIAYKKFLEILWEKGINDIPGDLQKIPHAKILTSNQNSI